MLLSLLLYNVLFIPIISANVTNITLKRDPTETKSSAVKETSQDLPSGVVNANKTKLIIATEGGSLVQSTQSLTLPKQNDTALLNLVKELGEEKSVHTAEANHNIQHRNGVVYQVDNSTSVEESPVVIKQVSDNTVKKGSPRNETSLIKNNTSKVEQNNIIKENKTHVNTPMKENVNKTEAIKKPLILSSEGVDKMDQRQASRMSVVHSSLKTIEQDQMQSPTQAVNKKMQTASRHPGMVMPVVITILVVPMFAVLGYMALKRGQEAWKNRHYKRMDFLLDGMYNE